MAAVCVCGGADCERVWAHRCSRVAARPVAAGDGASRAPAGHTIRHGFGDAAATVKNGAKSSASTQVRCLRSRTSAKLGRRGRLIREKVIGRSTGRARAAGGGRSPLRRQQGLVAQVGVRLLGHHGVFAVLHQPARQHSRGILFEPGIEQLRDFLAEIGGMAEAREFVTLQGITRRGEKELPRRLGFVVQRGLQGKRGNSNNVNTSVNSIHIRTYCGKLCKSALGHHQAGGGAFLAEEAR